MNKPKIKIYILFIIIFILLYNETFSFGIINLSQLWKIILVFYLLVVVIINKVKQLPNFVTISYFRAIKYIFNPGIYIKPLTEILDFSRYSLFPLFYQYLLIKKIKLFQIDKALFYTSTFFIISFLPFIFEIFDSSGKQISYFEGFKNITGIFQGAHAASVTAILSVLLILYFSKNYNFSKFGGIINFIIIAFGTYIVFVTYVRTGYLMLFIGVIIIYLPKKLRLSSIIQFTFFFAILILLLYYILETNQDFYNRIFDIRNGKQNDIASGRLIFWDAAFQLWFNGDYINLLFGFGFEGLTAAIDKETGLKVIAHNEFLNQLGQNGLIGLVLLIFFTISLFKFIYKRKKMYSYRISIAVYFVYVSLMMTQGGFWFYPEFFLALILYKLDNEFQQSKKITL